MSPNCSAASSPRGKSHGITTALGGGQPGRNPYRFQIHADELAG